jgi:CBS domain-containing protein
MAANGGTGKEIEMKASDIMTREMVVVAPDTPIRDVAKLMVDQRISGVPVIDHGMLVGIISENDLVRRVELGTEKTQSRWVQFLTSDDTLLAEYVHARGQVARDVMTIDVVTVAPDDPIAAVAEILETRHIKRVPVVDGGKVVGIVSRANLLQALVTVGPAQKIAWLPSPVMNNVTVNNGVVHLWGYVGSENERRAVRIAAERVTGVKAVRDHRSELLPPF